LAGDFARPTTDEVMQLYESWKPRLASVQNASPAHIVVENLRCKSLTVL